MRIGVDDSGGPTVAPGSSPTFSLGAVLFERVEEAEACEQTVEQLKESLNVNEFHYIHLTHATQKAFFEAILKHDFGYVVQTFVKDWRKHGKWEDSEFFYDRIAEKFAGDIEEFLWIAHECRTSKYLNAKVVCDTMDPAFIRAMGKHLQKFKGHRGRSLVEKVSSQRSISNNLVPCPRFIEGLLASCP